MGELDWLQSEINTGEIIETPQPVITDYYNDKTAFSNSMAKELMTDEVAFDKWYKGEVKRTCDDKYAIGQYLHNFMEQQLSGGRAEPECQFLVMPNIDKRTKAGKERYAELTKGVDLDNTYVLSEDDARRVEILCERFLNSTEAKRIGLFDMSLSLEQAFIKKWDDEVKIKGKLDVIGNSSVVIDWKSSSNYSDFRYKATAYGYDRQAAWYRELTNCEQFYFVVFDTINFDKWKICEVDMNGDFMRRGKAKMLEAMSYIHDYLENGIKADKFKYELL
jgi:hypothetical protein